MQPHPAVRHWTGDVLDGGGGCIDCKKVLHESMEKELAPIRAVQRRSRESGEDEEGPRRRRGPRSIRCE